MSDISALYHRMAAGLPSHDDLMRTGRCSEAALHPELNRYCDCWPMDSHLATSGGAGYINPSLLRPCADSPAYIAAAGPMAPEWYGPDTRPAFWSMVWHHQVKVVVALARPQVGVRGCADYISPPVSSPSSSKAPYGDIYLDLIEERSTLSGHATERLLHLRRGTEMRQCVQLEFSTWPDYGVPDAAGVVAALIRRVEELREATARQLTAREPDEIEPPLLVHCAGGVGRTGSFITAHSLYCEQHAKGQEQAAGAAGLARGTAPEDIASRVDLLRSQRHPYVVETPEQLALVVDVLGELRVVHQRGRS